jgi:hypothetical protein
MPQGQFYVITLRVANHAKRVDYTFENDVVLLVDEGQKEYTISPEGQAARAAWQGDDPCARTMAPGESCVTEVVFDVPSDADELYLRISMGGPIFDVVDRTIFDYGNRAIRLP